MSSGQRRCDLAAAGVEGVGATGEGPYAKTVTLPQIGELAHRCQGWRGECGYGATALQVCGF